MWSPHYGYVIDKVESVRRRFTKRLPGFHDMEYSARLDKLNSQSLEYRRLVADLILTYKIIFGLTDTDLNVYFRLKGYENARIRGNPYKIVVNQCRLNVRKNILVSVLLSLGIVCHPAWSIFHLYEPSEKP